MTGVRSWSGPRPDILLMRAALLVAVMMLALPAAGDVVAPCHRLEKEGRLEEAIRCYEPLLPVTTDTLLRFHIQTRLAWVHMQSGNHEQSLARFREALRISRELKDRRREAKTINFTGFLYQVLHDYPAALDHYQRARTIAATLGDRQLDGEIHYHLGRLHDELGDAAAATREYRASLQARRDAGDRTGEALTLVGLGMIAQKAGRLQEALRLFDGALRIVQAEGDRKNEARCLEHRGDVLNDLARPREAIASLERALVLRKELGAPWEEPAARIGLSVAYEQLGDVERASAEMDSLLAPIEEAGRKLSLARFRASMYGTLRAHYERSIRLLSMLDERNPSGGHAAAALDASERSRARVTLDSVQDALVRNGSDSGLLRDADRLRDRIELAERERDSVVGTNGALAEVSARIEALVFELRAAEEQIQSRYPGLWRARNALPLAAADIRRDVLDDETVLVEYFLGEEQSFRWLVTRDRVVMKKLPRRAVLERAATQLHELLAQGDQRKLRHQTGRATARVAELLLAGLELPRGTRRIVIVPDGSLHYVPYAALPYRDQPLIDSVELTVAPSASAVALLRRLTSTRRHAPEALIVIADPVFDPADPRVRARLVSRPIARNLEAAGLDQLARLPATRAEAEAIARLGGGATRKAFDFAASRPEVLDARLGRYAVIHFATHALIHPRNQALSGVVLSLVDERGQPVDGFVRVHDLYRLRLGADLVVLSGCRTATGKELRGEGLVGLVSAFMWAGSPRVVASYWDVKDQATAELMKRFYRAMLVEGRTPAAAMRAAQRSMKADARWQSPYYWAAFAVHGEWK
jgi:CHAT domain-containing protein/predicted negative regulator of RcsB-dependent stress response